MHLKVLNLTLLKNNANIKLNRFMIIKSLKILKVIIACDGSN